MRNWKLKAFIQKLLSIFPGGYDMNFVLQKHVTKGVELTDDYFYDRLNHASDHINAYKNKFSLESDFQFTLELGTGWYPIVPLAIFLSGAEVIYTIDIVSMTDRDKIKKTIEKFIQSKNFNTLRTFIPYKEDKMRFLEALYLNYENLTYEKILHLLNFHLIIGDAKTIALSSDKIQLIHSNNTFEHIYPETLIPILSEFKRLIDKSKGVMSHFIDMSDHFAHFDSKISIYNFLKFSESTWKGIDNSIQPQNRLRFSDYLAMYGDLQIPVSYTKIRPGDTQQLTKIKLDKKFKSKTIEDIAISHVRIESVFT